MNSTFGWPGYAGANLPSGGPAYPLSTPGVRLKLTTADKALSLSIGLFNGDPAGPATPFNDPDPQRRNRNGTNFRLHDSPLLIAEGAYNYNLGSKDTRLPGSLKLGYFHHFGRFEDPRIDNGGLSLADPGSLGIGRRLRGNDGAYAVIDQMLYRVPDATDQGLSVFGRIAGSPADRNLIDVYVDGGLAYKGLIPGRESDTFGVSFAYAKVSDRVSQLDRDTNFFTSLPGYVRSYEALIEVTYQAEIVPGWTVQPDVQYIFNPGGGIANPKDQSGKKLKNEAVFGTRFTIAY